MKRVGILTFQNTFNFGAQLQAYALQNVLNEMGNDVEVINYSSAWDSLKSNIIFNLKSIAKSIVFNPIKYLEFRKKFNVTKEKYSIHNIEKTNDKYDIFIVGSDQVWNPKYYKSTSAYLLDFAKKKKVAYAASFGVDSVSEKIKEHYSKCLEDFYAISIREKTGCEICKQLVNKKIYNTLDPTLLLTKEEWNEKFELANEKNEKYVLIYMLEYSPELIDIGIKYAKSKNLKYKIITGTPRIFYKRGVQFGMHPIKFLKLFYNAEYVFTNSFHGTIFSINFQKQFFVKLLVKNKNVNSRITDIMSELSIENRIINDDANENIQIDYNEINKILLEKKNESIDFLKKNIS